MSQSPRRRSLLGNGLRLLLLHPGALLWTYATNLVLGVIFSLRAHTQLGAVLNHSLASQRLTAGFDLGTAVAAVQRTTRDVPAAGASSYGGVPLYLLVYFLLVPGCLFTFNTGAPAHLAILLRSGARFFWRFVRITLLTLLISAAVLGPASALASAWANHVDERTVGWSALWQQGAGWLIVLLLAALLRLYFDLVECYTVLLDDQIRPSGFPDKRVRTVLLPALRTLGRHFLRAYGSFLFLFALGLAAFFLLGRIAVHMLAQPRVWPMFLLAQAGLFLLLATRFWQRGAEMTLACDNPLPPPAQPAMNDETATPQPTETAHKPKDAIPNPEPAVPSLPEPDPGIFHHE